MNKSKTILFFGNERLATGVTSSLPIFKSLLLTGYNIPAVIVSQANLTSANKNEVAEIVEEAKLNNITLLNPSRLKDIKNQLQEYGADAAVLVAYGKIIPQSIIDIFPQGIINIHPSRLPKHRGPTPIESVILAGESDTAVSIMQLSAAMDSGPIYAQQTVKLNGKETKQELADRLAIVGKELLGTYLNEILTDKLKPVEQSGDGITFDQLITKQDGNIDWSKDAEYITRQIRAYAGWPRSKTTLKDIDIIITDAHPIDIKGPIGEVFMLEGQLGVFADSGAVIIDKLVPAGKKEMDSASFLSGYRSKLQI
jgi:methionyl-tRNA formyltransferase